MSIRDTFRAKLATRLNQPVDDINEEQIDEVSSELLNRYSSKARTQLGTIASKRGPKSKVDKAKIEKRNTNIPKAQAIVSDRHAKAADAHSKASHAAFKTAAHDELTKAGYTIAHPGKNSNVYTKHDPETNSLFVAKHHFGMPSTRDSHHSHEGAVKLVSSNGTTSDVRHSSWSARLSGRHGEPVDLHAHHSKMIGDELASHHRWSKDSSFNQHMNENLTPVTDEQILEMFGEDPDAIVLAEDAEVVNEGRGRPRKDGTSTEGADREHIIMQLRKHVSLNGAKPIEFKDGSKHNITSGQARLAMVIHDGLRTAIHKGHFSDRLDASHESFKNAITAKSHEEAGKAPEVKSRISLPGMDRLKAKIAAEN